MIICHSINFLRKSIKNYGCVNQKNFQMKEKRRKNNWTCELNFHNLCINNELIHYKNIIYQLLRVKWIDWFKKLNFRICLFFMCIKCFIVDKWLILKILKFNEYEHEKNWSYVIWKRFYDLFKKV
jgi:hypothetical protein